MSNFLFMCVYIYVFIFYENGRNVLGKLGHQNTKELTLPKKTNSWCLEWRCLKGESSQKNPDGSLGGSFSLGIADEWWELCPHHFVFSSSFMPPSIAKIIIWQSLFFLFLQQGWQDAQGSWIWKAFQIRIEGEVISIERGRG